MPHPDESPYIDWEDESNEPDEMRKVPDNDELCPNGRSLDEDDE
jgi:hypothetical protein